MVDGVEDVPYFKVCDGSFDGSSDLVYVSVVFFFVGGEVPVGWGPGRGGEASADVALSR